MSNILFNNTPMIEFFSEKKTHRSPLKLEIGDLFSLSKDDAEQLSNLITGIAENKPPKFKIELNQNLLKRRS
jgi:hypothetical protein